MQRFIRYGVVPAGIFIILLLVTLILVPVLINVQRFVPEIEKQVSKSIGRTFTLGPELNVSFFPWLSISFSDMKIGNPPGFSQGEFLKIRTFEARIKVWSLFKKQTEISRFVVDGLSVNLEKGDSGKVNWDFRGEEEHGKRSESPFSWVSGILAQKVSIALLAVTDGQVSWNDREGNVQHKFENIMLLLNDYSPDRLVPLDCKVVVNGGPVAVEGKIGTFVESNRQGSLPLDVSFNLLNKLQGQAKGKITDNEKNQNLLLSIKFVPFALRDFFAAFDLPLPMMSKDFDRLKVVDMQFTMRGGRDRIIVEKGTANLDDAMVNFSFIAPSSQNPQVEFAMNFDRFDLDRYLFPSTELDGNPAEGEPQSKILPTHKDNYFSDIEVAGAIQVGELKIHGGTLTEVNLAVQGKDKVFTIAPVTFKTSMGQVESAITLDLSAPQPDMRTTVKAQGLDSESFLRDYLGWNCLRGSLSAEMALQFSGDNFAAMQKSLNGEATLLMRDGSLVGADILQMVGRDDNPKDDRGAGTSTEKDLLGFVEAKSVAAINNGRVQIQEGHLQAPEFNMQINGTADIFEKLLNLQLATTFVKTTVGKGGRAEKIEQTTRFSISGSFSEPELKNQNLSANAADSKTSAKHIVAQKLPSPVEDDVKNLVGKDLVDPAVVAQRFGLQVQTLRRSEIKKKFPVGRGKVVIGELLEESTAL